MGGKDYINPVQLEDVYGKRSRFFDQCSSEIAISDGDRTLMYCRVIYSVFGIYKITPAKSMLFAIHVANRWGGVVYSNGQYSLIKKGLYFYDLWGKYPVTWMYLPPVPGFREKYKIKQFKKIDNSNI